MTDDLRTVTAGSVAIRADADSDGRNVYGYAVRWDEQTEEGGAVETPGLREGFARGAFAGAIQERGGRPWPLLDAHRSRGGRVVGSVSFSEDDIGLRYEGRLLDTQAARDYAASIPAGNDGVSLEFLYRGAQSKRSKGAIIHTAINRIAALAGEYIPAYRGATVALRQDGGLDMAEDTTATVEEPTERGDAIPAPFGMSREEMITLARETATEVVRGIAERGGWQTSGVKDPFHGYKSLGELMKAAYSSRGEEVSLAEGAASTPSRDDLRSYAARALADVVFTAGANAGLASGNLITTDIKRIVNGGRPAITAFGGPATRPSSCRRR